MASALATAKLMMAIAAHPRSDGGTLHQFMLWNDVSRQKEKAMNNRGGQVFFYNEDANYQTIVTSPVLQAVKLFTDFSLNKTLIPSNLDLPAGVHCLSADSEGTSRYFIVNGTSKAVPVNVPGDIRRVSLFADNVASGSILKYGGYGDKPGEIQEILPREFDDAILPPFSVNVLKTRPKETDG
jgi:hypothetical protein